MPKKPDQAPETKPKLTEWQKRNLEFLQKKQEREEEKKRLEEAERKQAQLQAVADLTQDKSEESSVVDEDLLLDLLGEEPKSKEKIRFRWPKLPHISRIKKKSRGKRLSLPLVLLVVSLLLVMSFSIFMITPYSSKKTILVSGQTNVTTEEVIAASKIADSDYLTTLILKAKRYEKNVVKGNDWIKSAKLTYTFPNTFTLTIKEYAIAAYATVDGGYQPILETGLLMTGTTVTELPQGALVVNLTDSENLKSFTDQLPRMDASLISLIQTIDLANSKTTADLLKITMKDGNTVRVPLSDLEIKLPYYPKLVQNLESPAIVDMEVGIYTTNESVEASLSETRTENEGKTLEEITSSQEETVEDSETNGEE